MTTRTLTISALKMFLRNRQALFFTLFMPFIFIGIFGLIGFDKAPTIDLGIVVNKPTPATQGFLDGLKNVAALKIHTGSEVDERAALQKGDRALVMIMPDSLFPDPKVPIFEAKTQTVVLLKNISQEQQAQTAYAILTQIFDETTLQYAHAPKLFALDVQAINDAKNVKYIDFLLPGIIAMSIMQMAVFSVAFVFTDYKEKGILKRLLATPMKPYQFVSAQVITRLIVSIAQATILLLVGMLVFKTHVYGSWWLMYFLVLIGAVMFLGLGFTISGISKTVDSVPAIANIFVFPMLFLSGIFFPTTSMPIWLQHVVTYLPLQPFAHAMRAVVGNGDGLYAIRHDVYWMLGWAVILSILAVYTFSLEEKRQ